MQIVFNLVLSNAIFSTVLALVVFVVTRVYSNHFVAHLLWLVVLVKMAAPPLIEVPPLINNWQPVPAAVEGHAFGLPAPAREPSIQQPPPFKLPSNPASSSVVEQDLPSNVQPVGPMGASVERSRPLENMQAILAVACSMWLVGFVLWLVVALYRAIRFSQLLRKHGVPDLPIQEIAQTISARIGLSWCPQVLLTPARVPPFVWALWRPTVVLPRDLIGQLDRDQIEAMLAHELIHLRRGDHWIRRFEMLLAALYWWHPVFWWAVRELHAAEEKCCDASVVEGFPEHTYRYGELLLKAAEYVCPTLPATAIPIGQGSQLRRRVSMVLNQRFSRRLPITANCTMGVIAIALMPLALPGMELPITTPQPPAVAGESTKPQVEADVKSSAKAAEIGEVPPPATEPASDINKDDVQFAAELETSGNGFNKSESGAITAVFFRQPTVGAALLRKLVSFPELEYINLAFSTIADEDLVHLREIKGLKQLGLKPHQFNQESVVHLRTIPGLRSLFLSGDSVDGGKLQLLKQLPELEELRLLQTSVVESDLKLLQDLPKLSGLLLSGASGNRESPEAARLTDAGLVHIAGIQNLKVLNIMSGAQLTDEGMKALGGIKALEELQISSNQITDAGISHLRGLLSLKALRIQGSLGSPPSRRTVRFTDASLQSISELTKLQDLHLLDGSFTDAGLEHLSGLTELRKVFLARAVVTANGLKHLQGATNLESLYLSGTTYDDEAFEQLKQFKNLQVVNLSGTRLTSKGLEGLVGLKFVSSLDLSESRVTDVELEHVGEIATLTRLDLNGTRITDSGLSHLTKLENLKDLSLWGTSIGDAGMSHVKQLTGLTSLGLQQTRVGDEGMQQLSNHPNLSRLLAGGTAITDAGLKHLAGIATLEHLWLSDSPQITDEGVKNLQGLQLKSLQLGPNHPRITDGSMSSLAQMETLTDLSLDGARITDVGLARLADLKKLERLSLRGTDVTDEGVALLPTMPKLSWATLDGTRITDASVQNLGKIPNLRILWITGTLITEQGVDQLRRDLPKCQIRWENRD